MKDQEDQAASAIQFSMKRRETQECPFAELKQLRKRDPIHYSQDMGAFYVTRYEDIKRIKTDTKTFSNDFYTRGGWRSAAQQAAESYRAEHGYARESTLHRTDPPIHTAYRKLVNRSFTTARVREMIPYIESVVNDLIDQFIDDGGCDLVQKFTIPLPCTVIADQLGIPRDQVYKVRQWSDAMLFPGSTDMSEAEGIECAKLVLESQRFLEKIVKQRRASPQADMISDLANARLDGELLPMAKLCDLFEQMLTGGNESTTGALGSGIMLLLQSPALIPGVRDNPELTRRFVEEVLRLEPPVLSNLRVATVDSEIAGTRIPKGSVLILAYASGNRDEAVYPDAESLSLERERTLPHVAFGAGPHFCPGAPLARQEMQCAFPILLRRLKNLRLANPKDEFLHIPNTTFRTLRELKVQFNVV
ncbi:MAG: cytochrome P450 [Betaproteobacteria bacterium]